MQIRIKNLELVDRICGYARLCGMSSDEYVERILQQLEDLKLLNSPTKFATRADEFSRR